MQELERTGNEKQAGGDVKGDTKDAVGRKKVKGGKERGALNGVKAERHNEVCQISSKRGLRRTRDERNA